MSSSPAQTRNDAELIRANRGFYEALWAVLVAWTVWFAVALFNPRRRTLHDLAAGTEIRLLG